MVEQDRMQFAKVLAASLDAYGRRPPMADTVEFWFQIMKPFSMEQFRLACQQAVIQSPNNPPTPGSVLQILQKDDRPGVEEAWSKAVQASDEAETVIVTNEIMEAWGVAQPIFNMGDEVGARMAFKEAYGRLTASPAPANWWPSIGHDPYKRDTALAEAKRQGLLPVPQVEALLPPPVRQDDDAPPWERVDTREQIQKLKDELRNLQLVKLKSQEDYVREQQEQTHAQKQAIEDAIKRYKGKDK